MLEEIKEKAKKFFDGVNACHEWEHTERVYSLAMNIGKKENADLEVLALAVVLHDIGRKEQDESKGIIDHAERGAVLANEILKDYNLPKDELDNILHCIESHRFRKSKVPQTIEAKILFDSDKLDSIGAIGIGRSFSYAGYIGAKVHNKGVPVEEMIEFTSNDTAYREYMVKLKHLKDKMFTDEGKRIAEERHNFMEQFFNRLNKEVDGEL